MVDVLHGLSSALCTRALRRLLLICLVALVWVQTVGVVHRVAHAKPNASVSTHRVSDSSGVLAAILGEHSNAVECQLFDQTCPDLLYTSALWLMPVVSVPTWTALVLHERFALVERFYAARGPPTLH
ncbi:hypothetical protein [Limnohabitans sp.]|uniref:hypothetical protein n=1 Tax=Limnohabitans sp. TaxID=1907725 RepID=UPI00286F3F9C|nr:hypothetical protein [Limnohabitans sp.]